MTMTISVRCTPEWHARWVEAAEEEQRSLSNAVARVMNRWADDVLERKRQRLAARAAARAAAQDPPSPSSGRPQDP